MKRRGRRGLTPDDRAVWDQVRRTVAPMRPEPKPEKKEPPQNRRSDPRPVETPDIPTPQPAPDLLRAFTIGGKASAKPAKHVLKTSVAADVASAPLAMDAKKHKRMVRGREAPEARIDLHGLTLDQAHPALIDFLSRAHMRGFRLVLVITGKGRDRPDDDPIPTPRGVLRHHVPRWLSQAPLRNMVLQVRSAHQSHGGGGAYYVYLRRRG